MRSRTISIGVSAALLMSACTNQGEGEPSSDSATSSSFEAPDDSLVTTTSTLIQNNGLPAESCEYSSDNPQPGSASGNFLTYLTCDIDPDAPVGVYAEPRQDRNLLVGILPNNVEVVPICIAEGERLQDGAGSSGLTGEDPHESSVWVRGASDLIEDEFYINNTWLGFSDTSAIENC